MNALAYGWDGVLLEVDDPAAWYQALLAARETGELDCEEIVPAAATVLLRGVRRMPTLSGFMPRAPRDERRLVTIPVSWDGEDLDALAQRWLEDPARVLTKFEFTVAFCGFAPGFGYLTGLPERFHVPRLSTPRAKVPAGAVAVAGPYAGVYPRNSPGGWRLLGHTEITLFDPGSDEPALLTPGTRVRFTNA
jgi:KipI family sensor histidine kinase inhibitor